MKKADLLIHNIGQLLTIPAHYSDHKDKIGRINNAAIAINQGKIVWVGQSSQIGATIDLNGEDINAQQQLVCPAFVDPHTHISGYPYGRADDFEVRTYGEDDYAGIARKGGGIRTTIQCTQSAKDEELLHYSKQILDEFMRHGVGTVEAKSGYGLLPQQEKRQISILQKLNNSHAMTIVPTYLAHVLHPELPRKQYIDQITKQLLPEISKQVKSVDVFCDHIAFSVEEAIQIMEIGLQQGLFASIHTDQTRPFQGAENLAPKGVTSLSHLEHISEEGIAQMQKNNTIAILFPSCSLHLNVPFPPLKKLMKANITIALSTDWNPGSSPCSNMLLVGYFAAKYMKMPLPDIMRSITLNGAKALHLQDEIGSIEKGKWGDICMFDIKDWRDLFTQCGNTPQMRMFKKGKEVSSFC